MNGRGYTVVGLLLGLGCTVQATTVEVTRHSIPVAGLSITTDATGRDRVAIQGFGSRTVPGEPIVPFRQVNIAVPPDATIQEVRFRPSFRELSRSFDVAPASLAVQSGATEQELDRMLAHRQANMETAYAKSTYYPDTVARFKGVGHLRRYRYAQIEFAPFQYIPATGQARVVSELEIEIEYLPGAYTAGMAADPAQETFEPEAELLLDNFVMARPWYRQAPVQVLGSGDYTYLVLAPAALEVALEPLTHWKEQIGQRVKFIALETVTNDPGYASFDVQGKIRAYLRDRYLSWGSQYLLLVGDTDLIPMRECTVTTATSTNVCYTDQYYGELSLPDSSSWDADGDGVYGEYPDDPIDWAMELYVGRLPSNAGGTLRGICERSRDYEMQTGPWKKNALFCTAILNATDTGDKYMPFTDGGYMAKYLFDNGYFSDWTTRWGCEAEGIEPSSMPYDFHIGYTNVEHEWETVDYGIVNFTGHGDPSGPLRFVWHDDSNGNGMASHGEYTKPNMFYSFQAGSVGPSEPSIVYFAGCNDGRWDDPNAIAKRVIVYQAAVSSIGATIDSFYWIGWQQPSDGAADQSLQVFWNQYVTGAYPQAGKALAVAKIYYRITYGDSVGTHIISHIMTYYGDPSLNVQGVADRSNLKLDWPTAWTFPVVPRATADATTAWCPVSSTLPGFSLSTYLNYAVDNNGTVPAYDVIVAMQIDGTDVRAQKDWNWIDPGLPGQIINEGPYAVHGGRHTLSVIYDPDDTVLENSEADNALHRQFVWSPFELTTDTSYVWGEVPPRGSLGTANCEGFKTTPLTMRRIWAAVGFLPDEPDADPAMRLYEPYVDSTHGFAVFDAESDVGVGETEVVLYNITAAETNGPVYPGIFRKTAASSGGRLQWVTADSLNPNVPHDPVEMGENDVVHLYQITLDPGVWKAEIVADFGDRADLSLAVYGPDMAYAGMLDSVTGFRANAGGPGATETFPFRAPTNGMYGVAVWKTGHSDAGETATYTLSVTSDPTPPPTIIRRMARVPVPAYNVWLEWNEEAGWVYGIRYTSDLNTWTTSPATFYATENTPRAWLDNGTHTGGSPKRCRFYQVLTEQP